MTGSAIAGRLLALWAAYGVPGLEALGLAVVGVLAGAMLRVSRRLPFRAPPQRPWAPKPWRRRHSKSSPG